MGRYPYIKDFTIRSIDATEVAWGSTSSGLTSSSTLRYFDYQVTLDPNLLAVRPVLTQTLMVGSSSFTASSNANKSICNGIMMGYKNSLRSPNNSVSILGGCCNQINSICSCGASIIGGQKNIIGVSASSCRSYNSSILGGQNNTIDSISKNSSIISSCGATISFSNYSSIIGGKLSMICDSGGSVILGGVGGAFTDYGNVPSNRITGGCNNILSGGYYTKGTFVTYNIGNSIECSSSSVVLGGYYNRICPAGGLECNNSFSSIIGGFKNYLKGGRVSSILGGCFNTIQSRYSNITAGSCNSICGGATQSSIISGQCNTICSRGQYSQIINSCRSAIGEKRGLIINSELSYLGPTESSSKPTLNVQGNMIINSRCSIISGTGGEVNFIFGGNSHRITSTSSLSNVQNSGIVAGSNHCISKSSTSLILGGNANCISNSGNSVIVGGEFLSLNTEDKVVYVPKLKVNNVEQIGNTHSRVLIWANDEYVTYRSLSDLGIPQNGITGSTPHYINSSWTWSNVNIYNDGKRVAIGATAPGTASSTLEVKGSLALAIKSVGATTSSNLTAYTLTIDDFTVLAWGGVTISLPQVSAAKNRLYVIKKMNQATQSLVDITPFAGDNIEGYAGGIQLVNQYDYNILQSDGYKMWIKLGGAVGFNL